MPEISRFYGIIIKLYAKEHNPPHFHAEYQEFVAEYSIKELEIIAGGLPNRAHSLVLEWAFKYRQELAENWELLQQKKTPKKIEPLK